MTFLNHVHLLKINHFVQSAIHQRFRCKPRRCTPRLHVTPVQRELTSSQPKLDITKNGRIARMHWGSIVDL